MNTFHKNILSFIAGLVITGVAYIIVVVGLSLSTFSIAGESLSEHEKNDAILFYMWLIMSIATFIAVVFFIKQGQRSVALGIALLGIICLAYNINLGINYIDNFFYYEKFNKIEWSKSDLKPYKMAVTLVKEDNLIGLSLQEIRSTLGSENVYRKNYVRYFVSAENVNRWQVGENGRIWQLRIYFQHGTVQYAALYQGGFDED